MTINSWQILLPEDKRITVKGKTLEKAVYDWGQKQRNGRLVECGLLVRVKNPDGTYGYWSGEKFLECLG